MAVNDVRKTQNRVDSPVSEYYRGSKRVFDAKQNITVVKIFSGDWYISRSENEMIDTILGSCVSACIRDPKIGVGGMNHFLLPSSNNEIDSKHSDAARYGLYAMENLINGILKLGGSKDRLEVKVFGGGNVINNSSRIGSKNANFIRDFLSKEGYRIASEDLEGDYPRRVHYYPLTGKVMVRLLRRKDDRVVLEEEERYKKSITTNPIKSDIELF